MTPQEIRYECIKLSVHRSATGIVEDEKTAEQIILDAQKFEAFINGPTGCGSTVD